MEFLCWGVCGEGLIDKETGEVLVAKANMSLTESAGEIRPSESPG